MSPRLDQELVLRRLVRSRTQAQQSIAAGLVRVNGEVALRPAVTVTPDDALSCEADPYVSRGAHKLLGALVDLGLTLSGRALDAGASTGGFTQVLLERGCSPVYAVDVGTAQLAPQLRNDSRVVAREQTNLRDLELQHVGGEPVDVVVADVSFISLLLLVDRLAAVTSPTGLLLLMVKPQFEVGRELLGSGGVVRAPAQRRQAVERVVEAARRLGWYASGLAASRLPGPAGNLEYFVAFATAVPASPLDLDAAFGPASAEA